MLLNIKQAIPIFLATLLFVAFLLLGLMAPVNENGFLRVQAPWGLLTLLSMMVTVGATLFAVNYTCNSILNKGVTIQTQINRIIERNPLRSQ